MSFISDLWNSLVTWATGGGGPPAPPPAPINPPPVPVSPDDVVAQMLQMHNQERAEYNVAALTLNNQLCDDAAAHAKWMAVNRNMSHEEIPGTPDFVAVNFADRMKKAGYLPSAAGENIAAGQRSVQEVMVAWMNSPGHRQNVLDDAYWNAGFGHAVDALGNIYWIAVFAQPVRNRHMLRPGDVVKVYVHLPPALVRYK